ncbi:MAG: 1-acyl-sn-glycerol-3-phosphate acyltransferase [Alphaproteobacteria bacterium]|nr:1-acyl-sn-glycerol-3-phosphate acyltransferase [Alphaproteobacteria bacterium]
MNVLRLIFYALLVRPFLIVFLGLNTRNLDRLKIRDGAHLIAANHNSHLDAMVLMSLFKLKDIHRVKLVAAKDYFCRNALSTWFSLNIIGIVPIDRKGESDDPLKPVMKALEDGYTVVIFPEGSRGEPEKRQPLKYGITKILEAKPEITITPVFMHGLGKALPRGEGLFVPFICEINVGEELSWAGERSQLISSLEAVFDALEQEMEPKEWL